jgi:hypothetical protein
MMVAEKCTIKVDSERPMVLLTAEFIEPWIAMATPAANAIKTKKMSFVIDKKITPYYVFSQCHFIYFGVFQSKKAADDIGSFFGLKSGFPCEKLCRLCNIRTSELGN